MTVEQLRVWAMRQRPHQQVVIDLPYERLDNLVTDTASVEILMASDDQAYGHAEFPGIMRAVEPFNLPA